MKEYTKHPSFGYLLPDEVERIRNAKIDMNYNHSIKELDKIAADRGKKNKGKKKKIITNYMFTSETDGKINNE